MDALIKFLDFASTHGLTETLTLITALGVFFIVWRDTQRREKDRCYYRLKHDFDNFRTRQDVFDDKVDDIVSSLKIINKDLQSVVETMRTILASIDKFSKSSDDATSDMKLKFEEILHKVEMLSSTIDKVLFIFAKLNKDGDI